jgi:hypothetical protein
MSSKSGKHLHMTWGFERSFKLKQWKHKYSPRSAARTSFQLGRKNCPAQTNRGLVSSHNCLFKFSRQRATTFFNRRLRKDKKMYYQTVLFIEKDGVWIMKISSEGIRLSPNYISQCTAKKIRFMYSQKLNLAPASFPISTFSAAKYEDRSLEYLHKMLTETWLWKLETRTHSFISGNICFNFSVPCLCSVSTAR